MRWNFSIRIVIVRCERKPSHGPNVNTLANTIHVGGSTQIVCLCVCARERQQVRFGSIKRERISEKHCRNYICAPSAAAGSERASISQPVSQVAGGRSCATRAGALLVAGRNKSYDNNNAWCGFVATPRLGRDETRREPTRLVVVLLCSHT